MLRTLVDLPWLPPSEEVTRIAVGEPCDHQARESTGGRVGWLETRHRSRTRLATRMGRRLARVPVRRAVRPHDARHRTGPPRRPAPARPSDRHQLDRVVARIPGRPDDLADPVHRRTADHRLRARRRACGAHPERDRSRAVATCEHSERATRATAPARGVVGSCAVRKGIPGARPGDARTPRACARRQQCDRRTRELPARTADPGRRRRRQRHRRSPRVPERRRPSSTGAPGRLRGRSPRSTNRSASLRWRRWRPVCRSSWPARVDSPSW